MTEGAGAAPPAGAFLTAQVDDFFRASALFGGAGTYRMTGADLRRAAAWQEAHRATPLGAGLRLALGFNGDGARPDDPGDDLAVAAREVGPAFEWVSHGYRHVVFNATDHATTTSELTRNHDFMRARAFGPYRPENLITPEVSGLENPEAMRAIADFGVRFVVCDTSCAGYDNPAPNAGIPNPLAPAVLMIPRRPTDLYYDVSTPAEWEAAFAARRGERLAYAELLERESETLAGYLGRGEIDPWMFHQANLRAYDGARSLLSDLLDLTIAKHAARGGPPLASLPMEEIGRRMTARG